MRRSWHALKPVTILACFFSGLCLYCLHAGFAACPCRPFQEVLCLLQQSLTIRDAPFAIAERKLALEHPLKQVVGKRV